MSLDVDDFAFVRDLAERRSALRLADSKGYLVEARLAPLVQRAGVASIRELVTRMRRGDLDLQRQSVEALATGETSFFRDPTLWASLRTVVIPERAAASSAPLSFWSAASSTGQEAYSLALLLIQNFPSIPRSSILATDFSGSAVAAARSGRFTQLDVGRGLSATTLVRHFQRDGAAWEVAPEVRRLIEFREHNLTGLPLGIPLMDVILLRNVLIYFRPEAKAAALTAVASRLKPGGFLALGAAETLVGLDVRLQRVERGGTTWYQSPEEESRP
jgi:chemotaxis protein methyltransferase CheR